MFTPTPHADRLHNLPASLTPLVGREASLAALEALFRNGVRFVTLTGPGGAGKTRLALELARRLAPDIPDGAWFVPLAAVSDAGLLPATIATALGLRETGSAGPAELLAGWLREREALLVLDNFEQILPAAEPVARLLVDAPGLRLLVTSRAPLRLSGEQEFPVPPLDVPSAPETLDLAQLAANPAVELFVQRARAVRPEFALDAGNAAAIAQICARLDGLPLALELAAARLRSLSPQALAARLNRRLTALSSGPRDAPSRQRTLRDTIAWSFDLLKPADQALFRHLSVFVGSFSLQAAAAVAALPEDETLDGLERLIDQSLVQRVDAPDDAPRYAMLETVCEYADEQLVFFEEQYEMHEAHADWYLALAERLGAAVGSAEETGFFSVLDQEQGNLRAALGWRLEQGERDPRQIEKGLLTAVGLWSFWDVRGYLSEALSWLERFRLRPEPVDPALRVRALNQAGYFAKDYGDLDASDAFLDESLALATAIGDRRAIAEAQYNRARNLTIRGDWDVGVALGEEALATFRDLGDRFGVMMTLGTLVWLETLRSDHALAARYADEAIASSESAGDQASTVGLLTMRAWIAIEQGNFDEARQTADKAIQLGEQINYHLHIAAGHWVQAWVAIIQLDVERARERVITAIVEARNIGLTYIPQFFETLATVTFAGQHATLAARILGYAGALRAVFGFAMMPMEQRNRERLEASLSTELGAERFAAEYATGERMTAEAILAEEAAVNAASDTARTPLPAPTSAHTHSLTPRELDVLCLLVASRTNREIAEALFITQRTAATHVTNILTKLNLESRTAAAAWAVREGIV